MSHALKNPVEKDRRQDMRNAMNADLFRGTGRPRTLKRRRRLPMARALLGTLLAFAAVGHAEDTPPVGLEGPDVTIIETEDRTVFEYRQSGQLRMVKVVPSWGAPYYLYPRDPTTGFGDLEKADMLLPTWVIVEF